MSSKQRIRYSSVCLVLISVSVFFCWDQTEKNRDVSFIPSQENGAFDQLAIIPATREGGTPVGSGDVLRERMESFSRMSPNDPRLYGLRGVVREVYREDPELLTGLLLELKRNDLHFRNAFREYGKLFSLDGKTEQLLEILQEFSQSSRALIFDGALVGLVTIDPVEAYSLRAIFPQELKSSHAAYDSYMLGQAVSNGKGKEALEAARQFLSEVEQRDAIPGLFFSWADYDPVLAAREVVKLNDSVVRERSIEKLRKRWRETKPEMFDKWLSDQAPEILILFDEDR